MLFPAILFIALLAAVQFHFEKIVKEVILDEVNNNLLVKANAGEINFSVWENFPSASLSFNNIKINSPGDVPELKPFISKGNISLSFNLLDLISGNYTIGEIKINNALVNIFALDSLNYNYNIWKNENKEEKKNGVVFRINKIVLKESRINYHSFNNKEIIDATILSATLKGKSGNDELSFEGSINGNAHKVLFSNQVYHEIDFYWEGNFFNRKNDWGLNNDNIELLAGKIQAKGMLLKSTAGLKMDIRLTSKDLSIDLVKQKMNSLWPQGLNKYNLSGQINSNSRFSGYPDLRGRLNLVTDFKIDKGTFSLMDKNQGAKNIALEGRFSGTLDDKSTYALEIKEFSASINQQKVIGRANWSGKKPDAIQSHLEGSFQMDRLSDFIVLDSIGNFRGEVAFSINTDIPISKNGSKVLKDWRIFGQLQTNNLHFENIDKSITIENLSGAIKMNGTQAEIENLHLNYRESKFKIKGKLNNWSNFGNTEEIPYFTGNISCGQVDIDKLFKNENDKHKSSSNEWGIPFGVSAGITAEKINYKKLNLSTLKTKLTVSGTKIIFDSLNVMGLDGKANGSIVLQAKPNGGFHCSINGNLNQIDITALFKSFDNFEQQTLRYDHISGKLNAGINFRAEYDNSNEIILSSVNSLADLKISNGRLRNFSPLYSLSKYISMEELNDITFKELYNIVKIENSKIEFPQMEILSSALNVNLNGVHYFNNKIDYHFSILLSDLLNKKFDRKNKDRDEFEIFEENEEDNSRQIFVRLTGTVEKPEFSIDKPAMKKNRKEKWNEEKKTIQELIKSGGKKNEETRQTSFEKSEKMFTIENDGQEIGPKKTTKGTKEKEIKSRESKFEKDQKQAPDKKEKKQKKEKTENSDDFY